jgi:hypothetical protein
MIVDINLLSKDRDMDFEPPAYSGEYSRTLLVAARTALSHVNDNSNFFEAHFIHQRPHSVDATAMNGGDILGSSRIRHLGHVKSSAFVLYRD